MSRRRGWLVGCIQGVICILPRASPGNFTPLGRLHNLHRGINTHLLPVVQGGLGYFSVAVVTACPHVYDYLIIGVVTSFLEELSRQFWIVLIGFNVLRSYT